MNIKLNLFDLFKMAKHLNLNSTGELFEQRYLTLIPGQNGMIIPEIYFKKTPYEFCPFLINDLNENMELKGFCSLHPYIKPLVCILAPISRIYDSDKKTSQYSFTKPTENCPGTLTGCDLPISNLLNPIEKELCYENEYYDILNIIQKKHIKNYNQRLYYFDIDESFTKIITKLRSIYENA